MLKFLIFLLWPGILIAQECFRDDITANSPMGQQIAQEIDAKVQNYLNTFKIPGAVVLVGNKKGITFHKAYGHRSLDKNEFNSIDTIYDLASITKLFTATAIMQQIEQNKMSLGSKMKTFFPEEFSSNRKKAISLEDLLRHNSGFQAGLSPDVFSEDMALTWDNIFAVEPKLPYRKFKYSDINYILLGRLLEEVTNLELEDYIQETIINPLKMPSTQFRAYLRNDCHELCAPTQINLKRGHVHDPSSFKLGAVAGHAGLFATAKDLAHFASVFLNEGLYCGKRILSSKSIKLMTLKKAKESRGLGFDITSAYSHYPRGDYFANGLSFGHTGFTGTSVWIDPSVETFLIVLSNPVLAIDMQKAKAGHLRMINELANIVGASTL
jgi:serine-type D-Ala-D-Ala carboxypeptidase